MRWCAGWRAAAFKDIDRCAEAIRPAQRRRIHTFLSTSPVHMKYKLQKEPHEVYEMVIAQVTRARGHTDDVEWSSEDGTRTEHDFLCRCVEAAIKAGATTINIPDTVGYAVPEEYFALIKMVRERVPNSDQARFSVHCHDDLGMAVANSLAGIRAGARQIECTINGIGERAGNAALEEVVMAMRVRNDVMPFWTGVELENANAGVQAGFGGNLVPGAVQQGDRRPERVRARERHPPGRHAQAYRRPTKSCCRKTSA